MIFFPPSHSAWVQCVGFVVWCWLIISCDTKPLSIEANFVTMASSMLISIAYTMLTISVLALVFAYLFGLSIEAYVRLVWQS